MADSLIGNIKQYAQNTIDNAKGKVQEVADNPEDADYLAGYYSDDGKSYWRMEYWSENITTTKEEQAAIAKKGSNWIGGIDKSHHDAAKAWQAQNGMMKIVPIFRIQRFSSSLVTDIMNDKMADPQTQVIPIANVSVVPHNISFNFFDTTEGKIGVSNAVENHMVVECDIYVTDLVYYWWNHAKSAGKKDFGYNDLNIGNLRFSNKKPKKLKHTDRIYTSVTKAECKKFDEILGKHKDFEQSVEFSKFRSTFLTYYTGWRCYFVSHAFPTFYGSITDIRYDISEGESMAKWHIKIEEAIFYDANRTGKKDESDTTGTSGGSGSDSGTAGTGSDSSDDGNGGSGQ